MDIDSSGPHGLWTEEFEHPAGSAGSLGYRAKAQEMKEMVVAAQVIRSKIENLCEPRYSQGFPTFQDHPQLRLAPGLFVDPGSGRSHRTEVCLRVFPFPTAINVLVEIKFLLRRS
jgi:hypothetical protein